MSSLNSKHIYRPEIETLCILIGADVVVEENRRLFCIGRNLLLTTNYLGVFFKIHLLSKLPILFVCTSSLAEL